MESELDYIRQRKFENKSNMNNNEDKKTYDINDKTKSHVYRDNLSIFLLLILYTLQGIPLGLSASIPLLLKEKGASYEGLSLFSLVGLPFSFKLLWAPIVDSCYIKSIGRRKTWLIPIQLLTGIVMIVASYYIQDWLGDNHKLPNVEILTIYFALLYFLMATQDIAVDGWALTMLSRENVSYASTCNSIGQTFGVFLSNQGFIALSDSNWCHRYLGTEVGRTFVSLPGFMQYWGWVFVIVTVLIGILKSEESKDIPIEQTHTLYETYNHVISIFKLKPIQLLVLIQLTSRIAYAPADAVSGFKMQEYGMSKTDIASISPILMIIGLTLPALMSSAVSAKPIDILTKGIGLKLFTSVLTWVVTMLVQIAYKNSKSSHIGFYLLLIFVMILHEIAGYLIFIASMSFFAKISDPTIGGTYMTLLNTVTNLGSKWPQSTALWLLPKLTFTICKHKETLNNIVLDNQYCDITNDKSNCTELGGFCKITLDGYTIETMVCVLIGIIWLLIFTEKLTKLEYITHSEWSIINVKNI